MPEPHLPQTPTTPEQGKNVKSFVERAKTAGEKAAENLKKLGKNAGNNAREQLTAWLPSEKNPETPTSDQLAPRESKQNKPLEEKPIPLPAAEKPDPAAEQAKRDEQARIITELAKGNEVDITKLADTPFEIFGQTYQMNPGKWVETTAYRYPRSLRGLLIDAADANLNTDAEETTIIDQDTATVTMGILKNPKTDVNELSFTLNYGEQDQNTNTMTYCTDFSGKPDRFSPLATPEAVPHINELLRANFNISFAGDGSVILPPQAA